MPMLALTERALRVFFTPVAIGAMPSSFRQSRWLRTDANPCQQRVPYEETSTVRRGEWFPASAHSEQHAGSVVVASGGLGQDLGAMEHLSSRD